MSENAAPGDEGPGAIVKREQDGFVVYAVDGLGMSCDHGVNLIEIEFNGPVFWLCEDFFLIGARAVSKIYR